MPQPPITTPVKRREIFGWAMFDFANSSYTTIVVTFLFSVYFMELVVPSGGEALWGLGITISNVAVMVLSTFVGAIADRTGRKKAFLFATYIVCILGTFGLYLVTPGRVVLGLTLFVISNIAFALGENFAAAFLPEISTPKTIGRISGLGWGVGYLGGMVALLSLLPLVNGGFNLDNLGNLRLAWIAAAGFFFVAGLPTFLLLRERAPRGKTLTLGAEIRQGFSRVAETLRSVRRFNQLTRFLCVFFLFHAGLTSVIAFTGGYATKTLGFTTGQLFTLAVLTNLSAAGGAIVFGALQDRIGARRTVQLSLVLWIGICLSAFLAVTVPQFLIVGTVAGLGIGSLQSAARSIVGLFSPIEKSAEFFGFWGLAGKGAYAVGPLVFGLISTGVGSQRVAILSTSIFFFLGLIGMFTVDETKGRAAAEAWDREHGLQRTDREDGLDAQPA